ncbi:MAG TPA: diguanylate cyclase [Burkholderiaceae bacterium]|nr:diguanylate cyclase [Burkholderiaceae bacterium]
MASLSLCARSPVARWQAWLAALGVGLVLCAAAASAAAGATPAQLLELERAGRAKPRETAAQLATLVESNQADAATRLEALILQGWLLASVPSADEAEAAARALDARFAADRSPLAQAGALLVRARLAEQLGDVARSSTLIDDALARLPADAAALMRLRFLAAQAHIRNGSSKHEDAIRIGHEALALADAHGEAWRRAEARAYLAYSYHLAKQSTRALSLNQEALAIAQADGDPLTLARVSTVQAIVLDTLGDSDGEKRFSLAAVDLARQAGAKSEEALYIANLADYYRKNGEYATALQHLHKALPLTRELKNLNGEIVALAQIGLAQIALGQIDAGKPSLRLAIDIEERRGSLSGMADIYREMGQALERAGDLSGAVEAFHLQRTLEDQVLARNQQKAILEMQEAFDNGRRTRELELLHRQSAIQGEQLHARTLQQRLWALVAVCGLLSLVVAALLMRRVRDTNRRLADSNAQLKAHAEIDPLTGLSNRRHFQAAMRQLAADGRFSGTLFLADIDHFKRVNDCWGHASGDAVLVEIARRLRAVLREPDLIVRWGGEEFLVVVRALSPEAVEALAQRMLDAVGAAPVVHEQRVIAVTASIGYATFPIEPTLLDVSWERAINLVDTALYLAKAHGRNRAYGVRMINANDAERFDAVARSLEDAWRTGDVALTLLEGPGRGAEFAADVLAQAA